MATGTEVKRGDPVIWLEEVKWGLEPTWLWERGKEGEEEGVKVAAGKVETGKEEAGKEEGDEPRLRSPRAWRMAGCNWASTDPTTSLWFI